MTSIYYIAVAMVAALIFNRIVKKVRLPNVTGYLVAGLVMGPYGLKLISADAVDTMSVILTVALGFIAFSIGGEFKLENIKRIGRSVLVITVFQSLGASVLVGLTLIVFGFSVPLAITLGSIAAATAPAATLMVVRQYKAKGPLTNMLLPVVALDDAIGLVVFSVCLSIAHVMTDGSGFSAAETFLTPLREISLSLLAGAAIGVALSLSLKVFHSSANRICLVVCAVFLGTALAGMYDLSSLLVCMSIGGAMANMAPDYANVLEINDKWTPPLFLLFFVISGAQLDIKVLPSVGLLGVLYILSRAAGKYLGAFCGASAMKAGRNMRNYLGIMLLPQAGVAIGMSQLVIMALPQYGEQIRAVVLCATIVYELMGPLATKFALIKAGEIKKYQPQKQAVYKT